MTDGYYVCPHCSAQGNEGIANRFFVIDRQVWAVCNAHSVCWRGLDGPTYGYDGCARVFTWISDEIPDPPLVPQTAEEAQAYYPEVAGVYREHRQAAA